MDIIEWIGVLTGIAAVYLLYKNNIFTWPVGFINIGCFMWMFWQANLYGDFVVQLIFLTTGIWGWFHWKYKTLKTPGHLTLTETLVWAMITIILTPITWYYLKNYTLCSYPIAEAAILSLSLVGQCLTGLRKIENWYWWLVADLLMILVYYKKGLYPTSAYAAIVLVLGVFGLLSWIKMAKKSTGV